jgi:hypothetical protein
LASIELLEYSQENLAYALKNDFISVNDLTANKFHFRYLLDYFADTHDALAAKMIVIESDYVSRSYLNDYSSYYSLCFSDEYKKKCKRVHFFNIRFTLDEFKSDIVDNINKFINNDTYLGYIVVNNLPTVIIGATVLKTYHNNSHRFYITRECEVSLFGKKLRIQSLIFQEQDKVVSACATTALWIAFHKTSSYFQTQHPSPSAITTSAKNSFSYSGRIFPNKEGLDHFQIGNAIESVGLVFELRNKVELKNPRIVKSFIYSYCKLGLPVLLGLNINNKGRHLITISGFRYGPMNDANQEPEDIKMIANNINMFYAHDDRIGPFSRLPISPSERTDGIIETSWWIELKF